MIICLKVFSFGHHKNSMFISTSNAIEGWRLLVGECKYLKCPINLLQCIWLPKNDTAINRLETNISFGHTD